MSRDCAIALRPGEHEQDSISEKKVISRSVAFHHDHWQQPRCPSIGDWLIASVAQQRVEYCAATKQEMGLLSPREGSRA